MHCHEAAAPLPSSDEDDVDVTLDSSNRRAMPQGLADAVLDQLTDSIVVLDEHGIIVAVNEAWRRAACERGVTSGSDECIGKNFLTVCDATVGRDGSAAWQAAAGIQAVIKHEQPSFTLEYPCSATPQRRWFLLRVTPLANAKGCVVVQHMDITARKLAEEEQARLYAVAQSTKQQAVQQAQQLEAIFTAIQDGLVVFDQNGIVIRRNAIDRAIMGEVDTTSLSPDCIERRTCLLRFHDSNGTPLSAEQAPAARILRGEVLRSDHPMEIQARPVDGRHIDLSATGAPMRDTQGQIIGSVILYRDVTERRRLEVRTHELLEAMLAMVKALTMSYLPSQPEDRDPSAPAGTDSVALRLAELARQVFACERVSITRLDPATNQLLPVVRLGCPKDEAQQWQRIGPHFRLADFMPPELIERLCAGEVVVNDLTDAQQRGLPTFGIREMLVAPLRLDGRLLGVVGIDFGGQSHDYTSQERALAGAAGHLAAMVLERQRLMREWQDAEAQAMAAHEVTRQMDQFFAMASHDIRSPVTVTQGMVELALLRAEQLAAAAQAQSGHEDDLATRVVVTLEAARNSTDRLVRMTELLFDVARARSGTLDVSPQSCDLASVVREQVEIQRVVAPARALRLRLPPGTVPMVADADRLGQVLANYLTNALKYSPDDKPVNVRLRVAHGRATVSVRDSGPGLPQDEQRRVWDVFHRAPGVELQSRSAGAGSLGLGLHISKRIVESHVGGRVGVKSTVGHGSTFWFSLPLALPVEESREMPPRMSEKGSQHPHSEAGQGSAA